MTNKSKQRKPEVELVQEAAPNGDWQPFLHNHRTRNKIRLGITRQQCLLVSLYLTQRYSGQPCPYVQDAVPFLTDFERDFILTGMSRFEWDTMYTDVEEPDNAGSNNHATVMFVPIPKLKKYRCDVEGIPNYTIGFLEQGNSNRPESWYYRNNDWATMLSSGYLRVIADKVDQLNEQTGSIPHE